MIILRDGDKIYCKVDMSNLTKDKCYIVNIYSNSTICIKDDNGHSWWFGQIGQLEPWDMWFVTEKQWIRDKKLKDIGI